MKTLFRIQFLKRFDWLLLAAVILLLIIGLLTIYSIDESHVFFQKQIVWGGISLFFLFLMSFIDYRIFKNHSFFIIFFYTITVLLLVFLLIVDLRVRGAASWLRLSSLNFQPAELIKIVLILLLAKYFSIRHIEMYRIRHIAVSALYVGAPLFLILAQPDMGSAMILIFLWLGIILIAGIKPYHFSLILGSGIFAGVMGWLFFLKDYQKARILFYLRPETDPLGHGYNIIQSLSSIGSAGFWGKGLGHGSQARLGFLPEAHTDFVFAAFAEEWGGIGIIFLTALFVFLFYRIIKISIEAQNNFARICALGVALVIFSQVIINIGMNVGLLPITGITLPFLSYGGSSLLISFISIGLLESIRLHS